MAFVFSSWYIVMLLLVAGIAACLVVFFKMDKKDKVIIDQFVKDSAASQEEKEPEAKVEETKSNE